MSEHLDLAQFALYRNAKTYAELKQIVSDFHDDVKMFTSSANQGIVRTFPELFKGSSSKCHQFGLRSQDERSD